MRFVTVVLALSAVIPSHAFGQTATDRAGELKTWREQCADPDVELRTAYVEEALASKDSSVVRICTRLALESDNADIRNLGLRAAVAANETIDFTVTMPEELAAAIAGAGEDQEKLERLSSSYIYRDWALMRTGLSFAVTKSDIAKGSSIWQPLVNLSGPDDRYSGKAVVTGDRVVWIGLAGLSQNSECRLTVQVQPGAELAGLFQCRDLWPFPVRAKLL